MASRRGEQPWKDYDVVEGGVANDQVIDTDEDYYVGRALTDKLPSTTACFLRGLKK